MTSGLIYPRVCRLEATEQATRRLGRLQQVAYAAILEAACGGRTANEVAQATGNDRHTIQPRISELHRMALVIPSGKRRPNPSGKKATVWIVSEYAVGIPKTLLNT